jgi:hypothetical protein
MKTVAQILKHDFKSKGSLFLYDSNGNRIYYENSDGYWVKRVINYDSNNNLIYRECSDGYWSKRDILYNMINVHKCVHKGVLLKLFIDG